MTWWLIIFLLIILLLIFVLVLLIAWRRRKNKNSFHIPTIPNAKQGDSPKFMMGDNRYKNDSKSQINGQ